jgi:hypothetical protein
MAINITILAELISLSQQNLEKRNFSAILNRLTNNRFTARLSGVCFSSLSSAANLDISPAV